MTLNPTDVIAGGASETVKLCDDCIDAYRNGIEPGGSACEARFALLNSQGTACAETALDGHEGLNRELRARIEDQINPADPDAPIPGSWTDCTGNSALY